MTNKTSLFESLVRTCTNYGTNNCWLWPYSKDSSGYGKVGTGSRIKSAHRVSYEFYVGQIPLSMHVCHRCDTPSCVNPAHLFIGTAADNKKDSVNKNRHHKPIGVLNGRAILTAENVLEIKDLLKTTAPSVLALKYRVSKATIYAIKSGSNWGWLK